MKRIIKLLMIFTIMLSFVLFTDNKVEASGYRPGDIFITKSTSSKGLTGHTGIAISSTTILHTSGRKSSPYPTTMSITKWFKEYPKTKVVRPKSAALGKKAANMAKKYFKNKKIPYLITSDPKNIKNTYCSEIVWYSYYKAGKTYKVPKNSGPNMPLKWRTPSIIKPYDYINQSYLSYNGFIYKKKKW
ncbi:MAG TPA: hypothetical protein VIG73_08450 [Cerasibacillus sp.]|uniref:hypothetical protein n=1 Tax=Cerasibacillus sp. TaxID=2498711 RepID=UPI002F3F5C6F